MKKYLPLLVFLLIFTGSYAQEITVQDTVFMHRLSISRVKGFLSVLNVLANVDIDEASRQYALDNSYAKSSTNRVFLSDEAIIEDDIDPANNSHLKRVDKKINNYLNDFNLQYQKTSGDTVSVKFSNIRHSNVKKADFYYVKVFYESTFSSKRKNSPKDPAYSTLSRVAEIRFEKVQNVWLAFISRVAFATPEDLNPETAGKNDVVVTQIAQIKNEDDAKAEKANQEAQKNIDEYRKLIQEGEALLNKGKYEESIEVYTKARVIAYGDARADQGIGKARESLANKKENHQLFAKNLLEDMRNSYARRRYEDALVAGQQALIYKPNDQETLKLMNEISDKKRTKDNLNEKFEEFKFPDDYKDQYDEYRKLSRKDEKNPDWYLGMGKCELALKDLKGATGNLKKALDLDPTFEQALLVRSKLNEAKNDIPGAVADLEKYTTIKPTEAMVFSKLGQLRAQAGNTKKALDNFNKSVELEPSNIQVMYNRGMFFEQSGDFEASREDFTDIIRKNETLVKESLFHRGYALAHLKKYKEAGLDFTKAKTMRYDDPFGLARIDSISNAFYQDGLVRSERAITQLKNRKTPADSTAAMKLVSDAFIVLNNSIFIKQNNSESWFLKGKLYSTQRNFVKAIQDGFNQAVQYSDEDYFFLYNRGVAFHELGSFDNALKDFEVSYSKNTSFYFALSYKGVAQMSLRNFEDARTAFLVIKEQEKKLLKTPGYIDNTTFFAELYNNLGRCEYELGGETNFKSAAESFKQSLAYDAAEYPQAYHYLGKAYYAVAKPDKAVVQYTTALSVGEKKPAFKEIPVYEDLGQALTDLKKYSEASETYSDLISMAPGRVTEFVRKRGNCYFQAGNYDLALKDFDFLSEKDSLSKDETNYMGGVAAINMNMPDKAINYLQRYLYVEESPLKVAKTNFALGCALLQKQNEPQAQIAFEKAFKLSEFKGIYKRDKLENLLKVAKPAMADSKEFKKRYLQ